MRAIYFLLIFLILLSLLQNHSIYAQRYHPLAKLWKVDDTEVPEYLGLEKNLTAIDEILRPILEQDDFISSFGGTFINIFENHIVINTVNYSKVDDLLALPQIKPHEAFLYFKKANNSMNLLKHNFDKISFITQIIHPKKVLIYIDMRYNNVVLYFLGHNINNTEFIDAVKSFNPTIIYEGSSPGSQNIIRPQHEYDSDNSITIKALGGDGLYNSAKSAACSLGFWATNKFHPDELYIITAGHCYNDTDPQNNFYLLPWNSTLSNLPFLGSMVFDFIEIYDFGVIHVVDKDVSPSFVIRNDDTDQYKELPIIDGAPVSSHGVHICKSGYSSRFTCGYVLGLNGIYAVEDGFTVTWELIITSMYGKYGDSGGSVFSFASPQDLNLVVVHGIIITVGLASCSAQSIDTIFNQLRENTFYDLILYLGGS
ncbi:hypothetical protein C2G38_2243921 [Gigaspora rosea]|uniref:Peptidase S1 domain-containing protein n=1 Tax=Gigaspora rosea TaxID=44941 RepID=A0A397VI04_9GLOM|nr:hypothetical protein C2G38_2243921 [Gigaspora rosea]